ncbi:MAG: class I SAM-dependent methyltransferase [Deltaproteobacteria bacterium]|nr:class I SAM-dependent methyltransferase [Deltaproteobacteria bacterium]
MTKKKRQNLLNSDGNNDMRRLFFDGTKQLACYLQDFDKFFSESEEQKVFSITDEFVLKLSTIAYSRGFDFADEGMAFFRRNIQPFMLETDFASHMIRKPYGYPGDFLAMEKIWEGCNIGKAHIGSTTRGRFLNAYAIQLPICRATNERVYLIKDYIEDCIRCVYSPRIASIGAGSCIEIRELVHEGVDLSDAVFTLVDFDQNAIAYARKRLFETGVPLNTNFVHLNVVKEAHKGTLSEVLGKCDLIYVAGFFDYLNIRSSSMLARILLGSIRKGGQLIIVNAHPLNPTRFWMEYAAEWYLQYKTEEQMKQIAEALEPDGYQFSTGSDGVYQYVVLNKDRAHVITRRLS